MSKKNKLTLFQYLLIVFITVSVVFTFLFFVVWYNNELRNFDKTISNVKKVFIDSKIASLKSIVEQFKNNLDLN